MGSHSVTCHPTQVNAPRLYPSDAGRYSIYLPEGMEDWVDLGVGYIPRRFIKVVPKFPDDSDPTGSQTHDLLIISPTS